MVSREVRNLRHLQAGDSAFVAAISNQRAGAKRLADLGFVGGAELTMVRCGKPCIVRIDDRLVGLGLGHQEVILLSANGGS